MLPCVRPNVALESTGGGAKCPIRRSSQRGKRGVYISGSGGTHLLGPDEIDGGDVNEINSPFSHAHSPATGRPRVCFSRRLRTSRCPSLSVSVRGIRKPIALSTPFSSAIITLVRKTVYACLSLCLSLSLYLSLSLRPTRTLANYTRTASHTHDLSVERSERI